LTGEIFNTAIRLLDVEYKYRDDPIDKYIPSFAYRPHGWSANRYDNSTPVTRPPITFRQLASHLSGMGRDYPPENIQNPTFPRSEWNRTREMPTEENILEAIRTYPLIAPQYKYPIYSNTGFNVLGMANLAAAQQAYPNKSRYATFEELIKADIFDPIGLDSSFYEIPPGFENRMAVSLPYPQEAV
jgi:CubicO group peptidase (beta-lactamase class C family)